MEEFVQPEEVIVDSIDTGKFDSEDLTIGEDGGVIRAYDRENNKTFVLKGNETKRDDAPDNDGNQDTDDNNPDDDNKPEDEKEEGEEAEYENHADYILKRIGYDKDNIKLDENGDPVKIADLTPDQQLDIIVEEFDNQIEALNSKIKELESKPAELKFDDPAANEIVEYLKNGGDLQQLAKEIISRDPAAQAKILTDDEIIKLSIKKEFPSYSDKDIEDEFKEMTQGQRERRAKAYRAKMEAEKPSFSDLTEAQKAARDAEIAKEKASFVSEVENFKKASKELKSIAGVPLTDEVRNYLVSRAVPKDYDQDSDFVKELQNNPKKILELQFYATYGQKILDAAKKQYYAEGLRKGQEGKEGLSDVPLRTYSTRQTQTQGSQNSSKKAPKEPIVNLDNTNFDKWLQENDEF